MVKIRDTEINKIKGVISVQTINRARNWYSSLRFNTVTENYCNTGSFMQQQE